VAAGRGNAFAVATAEEPFIRIWNRDTGVVTQFGRAGDGPGEMRRPIGLVLGSDSVVVAGSALRKRLDSFGIDGTHRGDTTLSLSARGTFDLFISSPSGDWAFLKEGVNAGGRVWRLDLRSGQVAAIELPPSLLEGNTSSPNVAASGVSAAVSDDGAVVLGDGDVGYRLARIHLDGTLMFGGRDIPKGVLPALSKEESERQRQETITRLQAMNPRPTPEMIERMAASAARTEPRDMAHFTRVFDGALRFDSSGRLWVRTPRGNFSNRTVFDVFAGDLTYLGEVMLDEVITYWHIGGGLLVAAGFDDRSVPIVKVWAVK
jgi:hypothetical protein